jgi:hypothetical protein
MTARDLEGLLRAGDPEDRSWVPPDFELVRARAAAAPVIRQAHRAQPRRIAVLGTIAAACALAVVVAAIALAPLPRPVGSSASPTATTMSVTERAAVARLMGVPPEQVVPTEDGAVAVRLTGSTLALLIATRDPANASGWAVATIHTDEGFSPGANGVDVLVCSTPRLVRSVFVFGQLGQAGVTGPLQLTGLPVVQAADVLGGDLVSGLYLFALRGPLTAGSLLTVTSPDAPTSHGAPGHPSFKGWAQISIPAAQPCVPGASPSPTG